VRLQNAYKGTAIHAVDFRNAKPYRGGRAVIIGSANTAHDIMEDFIENEASEITMVQRSKTFVLPAEYICDVRATLARSLAKT
jgi:cation diffusion facilitator CzcD-associated flavoprotein CzcO